MTEENQSVGGVNFSDINNSKIHTGDIAIHQTAGGDIVGRDKLTIGQQIINLFTGTSDQQRNLRNRQVMLTAVRKFWVEGVLEQSLHGAPLIELGMHEKKEAVTYPWDIVLQRPNQENQVLPAGTKIIDVFDQGGRSLLILGEPGSGKTTVLLELARQTIDRAEKELNRPIPVVFNLSSWAKKWPKLDEWLVEELNTKYSIQKKIGRQWVENNELLLLLDGLDEVAQAHRAACIEAINSFYKDSMMPLVVCSRMADYEEWSVKLGLEQAVILQPLTKEQVQTYLNQFEVDLSILKRTIEQDANLQALTETPLMLSIMALAYQGLAIDNLPHLTSIETQRRHLFEIYVKKMFERKGMSNLYSADKTRHCLSWLARRMVDHSQTVFLVERLQPTWLPLKQRQVHLVGNILSIGLIFGLTGGLMGGLDSKLIDELLGGLIFGLNGALMVGLIYGLSNHIKPVKVSRWSWQEFKGGVLVGLPVGLSSGLIFGLSFGLLVGLISGLLGGLGSELIDELIGGLEFGLSFGLIGGLIGALTGGLLGGLGNHIRPVKILRWLWQEFIGGLLVGVLVGLIVGVLVGLLIWLLVGLSGGLMGGLIFGLSGGLIGGLIFGLSHRIRPVELLHWSWQEFRGGLIGALIFGLIFGLVFGLRAGLSGGLIVWLIIGLIGGLNSTEAKITLVPNQGIWASSKNGLLVGLMSGLIFGLTGGLIGGVIVGLSVGLIFGLDAFIQHFCLRYICYWHNYTPWHYVRFLDYAAERILLRKVGGGYVFIHRYLMEYFASLETEAVNDLPPAKDSQ